MQNKDHLPRGIQLLRGFARLNNNLTRFAQKTASMNDLSVPQYIILITIAPQKEMTQKVVGEKTFLPKSTLSQAVDGLVQAGLLYRKQVEENRREMLLSLSNHGEELLSNIHRQEGSIHQVAESAVQSLSEQQFEDFMATLQQMAVFFEDQPTE
ncbi:MarR family winged helix-turn-helix transcriptional regulator [Halobacillus salinarum]|uniref:MarR family winged helix-turn-helix transcriptional regulator n=1 Tax=Halobacillus salinarum TaxID=2932257 RepID=A0ABY4EM21_9BACI|nr:MarR family winged helix-turn-helix transcriptional regulator [Halobacillus salinarum]UOQ45435.1 MarR family winged helix-turn-helix transcriptional regulator [Halobacillus salinarum]